MVKQTLPLEPILIQIEKALDEKLYYLAIVTTLTLPDICVSLESSDGRSTGKRYKDWFNKHLAAKFSFITGEDLYSLRCGVVHNGRFGSLGHTVSRVLFALPSKVRIGNGVMNDAYIYSAEDFCRDFIEIVRKWYSSQSHNANVRANESKLVQYRPDGLRPFIRDVPVIG